MGKVIAITGTPGTGKSTLAKLLCRKFGFRRLDLHHHYAQLAEGYDRTKQCYIVDARKLAVLVQREARKHPEGMVVDTHLAHLLPRKLVKVCIVLTCSDLKLLYQRLKRRKYAARKIHENLQAEIFQVCLDEARERRHRIMTLDTAKVSLKEVLLEVQKRWSKHYL